MSADDAAGRQFRRMLLRSVGLPLVITAILTAALLGLVHRLLDAARWVEHSDTVISRAQQANNSVILVESNSRGYLISGHDVFRIPYERERGEISAHLERLRESVRDNPEQSRLAQQISATIARWLVWVERLVEVRLRGGDYEGLVRTLEGHDLMTSLQSQFTEFIRKEEKLRQSRLAMADRATHRATWLALSLGLLLSLVLAYFSRRHLLELARVHRSALVSERATRLALEQVQADLEGRVSQRTRDLSEAKQELERQTILLEASNRELEAFCYSVSHDLRAPLRGIDGFSQALLEDYSGSIDEVGRDYLRRVRSGTQRMGQLIDDLLRLSRLTRTEMIVTRVDLSLIARNIVEELRRHSPARDVEVRIDPDLVVDGDAGLLSAAFENLLSNAWKFTSHTAKARIELGRALRNGIPTFYIRDNGAGFDMAYSDKLFGAFQRLHGTKEFAGTGVGLATVRRIIHRHGGDIEAEGKVGEGAVFYFTLGESKKINEAGTRKTEAA